MPTADNRPIDHNTDPFDVHLEKMPGIGSVRLEALASVGVLSVGDLLTYIPRKYLDRSEIAPISELCEGEDVTLIADVTSAALVGHGKSQRYQATLKDESGSTLICIWFAGADVMRHIIAKGDVVAVTGPITAFRSKLQMVHPEIEVLSDPEDPDLVHMGRIVPIYPLTAELRDARLNARGLRKTLRDVLDRASPWLIDPLPEPIRILRDLLSWPDAVEKIHFPESMKQALEARKRLVYDEFFEFQLELAKRKKASMEAKAGIAFTEVGPDFERLLKKLPFDLTAGQKRVLTEIREDMRTVVPMNRLLQGDVGSGKTLVAVLAMLIAQANGKQSALMVPTEVLAEQHHTVITGYMDSLGISTALLTGSQNAAARRETLQGIANGFAKIVIGTHALLSQGVEFSKLGLVVIDEQHRFGVIQRHALRRKGQVPDLLVMTATPIPRTLAMTAYGDLDVSILDEKPAGRTLIKTIGLRQKDHEAALKTVREAASRKEQSYIIFPLVEKTEKSDLASAKQGFETLRDGPLKELNVGLLHGRIPPDERDAVMSSFKSGTTDVLVATTVIEVGVDVPTATVMIIENAEKFGLSQLHQLRGRIGRSDRPSFCYLVVDDRSVSPEASQRINAMLETSDGFEIAERDLTIRGPGEMLGTKQAGDGQFRIADLRKDADILTIARQDTLRVVFG